MSGVRVIRHLLAAHAPLVALVPATRIAAGVLAQNTVLPAIAVTSVSGTPRLTVAMNEPNRMHTERVQVSVLVKAPAAQPAGGGYPALSALMLLVLAACPNQHGTLATVNVDSILPDTEGPDLDDEAAQLLSRSRDFFVKWKSA